MSTRHAQALLEIFQEVAREVFREEHAGWRPHAATRDVEPEMISVGDYAKRMSLSKGFVRKAIRHGRLKAVRFGRAIRVPADAEIGKPATSRSKVASPAQRAAQILAKRSK